MKRIRYDGPTHRLVVNDQTTITRGFSAKVDDNMAKHLVECDYADVTVLPDNEAWPKNVADLDALAATLGFAWPVKTDEKPLTRAEKVDALEDAGYQPDGSRNSGNDAEQPEEGGEAATVDTEPKE